MIPSGIPHPQESFSLSIPKAEITDMCHHAWQDIGFLFYNSFMYHLKMSVYAAWSNVNVEGKKLISQKYRTV